MYLLERSDVILTDSGGIQEVAPSLGKLVLVLRDVTERTEAVDAGVAVLVRTQVPDIVSRTLALLDHPKPIASCHNPFGDGYAAGRIVRFLRELPA